MENSVTVPPQKLKIKLPYNPVIPLLDIMPQKNWKQGLKEMFVRLSEHHSSQQPWVSRTRVSVNNWMDRQNICICAMECYSVFKRKGIMTWYNMAELWGHYAKWNRPVTKRLYDSPDRRHLKLVAQRLKRLPAVWETQVRSLGQEDSPGEGNGNPLQCSCLENPMDGGAWWATVHGVTKSRTRLSCFTFTVVKFIEIEHRMVVAMSWSKGIMGVI